MTEKLPTAPAPENAGKRKRDITEVEEEFRERPLVDVYEATIAALEEERAAEFNYRNKIRTPLRQDGLNNHEVHIKAMVRVLDLKELIARKKAEQEQEQESE